MAAQYDSIHSNQSPNLNPYGSGDPYYNESTGYITPARPPRKGVSPWIKFGIPVLVAVIVAAVVGGVLGSRAANDSKTSSKTAAAGSNITAAATDASAAVTIKEEVGRYATATNSEWMMPIYPSTTNTAVFTTPTFISSNDSAIAWPTDPFQPSNPQPTVVRTDRPRIIAPKYKWEALPTLIANDPYLKGWNETIFGNASDWYSQDPVAYYMDGDSGILDVARRVKERIKAWGYVYQMTNDTKWVDRAWTELKNAVGNNSDSWGPDNQRKWNPAHFLDTAELSHAYGLAYDWMYDMWTEEQKEAIRYSLIYYGLNQGLNSYTNSSNWFGWWQTNTTGNWNCVCNGGLTVGALAILGDDTTGVAESLLNYTVPNAKQNCAFAPSSDGTWSETANYWYFGTTGHAEMASALLTATGSSYDLFTVNDAFSLTAKYHMYSQGATSLFNYGDCGPNKYSTTANALFLHSTIFDVPAYALYQREQYDAAEPWSMFWYDPTVSGAFWDGLPLDQFFDAELGAWCSMRSSWTDGNALYVAMKAGKDQGHQTHNDLDTGDFVIDALGTRWAGELGSGNYLSTGYFSNDSQDSQRWLYYRKRTEGQNTILIDKLNQHVSDAPTVKHDSSNTTQGSSTVETLPSDSTAYWMTDMTSAYFNATSVKRGVRLLNQRRQVLIQDEITASASMMWRMHTNATVNVASNGTTATLTLDGETMIVSILSGPSGANFTTSEAVRFASDPTPPEPDQANPNVTVLIVEMEAGTNTLEILFNPQWSGMSASDFVTPPSVALDSWTLTSHNT
ncbi:hypothetical protein FISHEDRAFT_48820 [Fistulina hepatica ATCC 64428]|uniref:Heparinase II/III-like C-terminal domain-containing protein n=1 Tax=Fistulina hepatica ATCC 64428 TaxID=1128425 RepID=A0A0D7A4M1_9AGAR|nr:hypothetical protein FISHEDRAFT_48820 [Fistulina hepatica ATCC 64428]